MNFFSFSLLRILLNIHRIVGGYDFSKLSQEEGWAQAGIQGDTKENM